MMVFNFRKGGSKERAEKEQEAATDGETSSAEGKGPSTAARGNGKD